MTAVEKPLPSNDHLTSHNLYNTPNSTMTVQTRTATRIHHSRAYSATSNDMDQSDDKEDRKREVSFPVAFLADILLLYADYWYSTIVSHNENSVRAPSPSLVYFKQS